MKNVRYEDLTEQDWVLVRTLRLLGWESMRTVEFVKIAVWTIRRIGKARFARMVAELEKESK